MGQTPSRQDNASTRTLHSSSINSGNRPMSFLRRLSQRLNHPTNRRRRFGRQQQPQQQQQQQPQQHTLPSSAASMSSSMRRATVAATSAAAAATGPPRPPHSILHHRLSPPIARRLDGNGVPVIASSASSTSSTSGSDLSHIVSEIISSAILAGPNGASPRRESAFFSHFMQMPVRSEPDTADPRLLPIIILGYRSAATPPTTTSSASSIVSADQSPPPPPPPPPPFPTLHRRPRSVASTSSSLATLQSMPLSTHSRTQPPQPQAQQHQHQHQHQYQYQYQQQQQQQSPPSPPPPSSQHQQNQSSPSLESTGQWHIYVLSGPQLTTLSDNSSYEDLLWLSSVLGPARPVTTTQASIDATLPVHIWSDDTRRKIMQGTERCLVCLDDFVPKQSVRVLKCRHVFHVECVDRWLVESRNSCPVCRGVPVEQSQEVQTQD